MSEKEERATPPVIPTIPSPPTTPTKVLVRELKREPAKLGERTGSFTLEQSTALQTRQYPFWYRHRAAFGSLIIVNVCIGTLALKQRFLVHEKVIGPNNKVTEAAGC